MDDTIKSLLIEAVRNNPALYDVKREDYKDNNFKRRCWERISKELGVSVAECKKNWEQLRNCYRRCRREENKLPMEVRQRKKKKWLFYHAMGFIDEFISVLSESNDGTAAVCDTIESGTLTDMTVINHASVPAAVEIRDESLNNNDQFLQMDSILSDANENGVEASPSSGSSSGSVCFFGTPTLTTKRKIKTKVLEELIVEQLEKLSKVAKTNCDQLNSLANNCDRRDDDDVFGQHVANRLRELDDDQKDYAKLQIECILFNAKRKSVSIPSHVKLCEHIS